MEISEVRKRVHEAMARARQRSTDRRARADRASQAFGAFLERTAVPLVRQIANVLRADGYRFNVSTPAGSVRLASDRAADDFVEVLLDTTGESPKVVGRTSRSWGRRVIETDHVIATGDPETITEEELLTFLLKALEPFVER